MVLPPPVDPGGGVTTAHAVAGTWRALVAFSRPHTIIGTVVAVVVLDLLAQRWVEAAVGAAAAALIPMLVAALATNVFIVGINQVTDVAIDRINKPWLPLAAGTMSLRTGRALVAVAAAVALGVALAAGPWLLLAVVVGALVGGAYSVPPLRFKRHHLLAAASIALVRALVVNLALFLHAVTVLGGPAVVPAHVVVLTAVVLGVTLAIAWCKDLPDIEGDAAYDIATLPLVLGPARVLAVGTWLLRISLVCGALAAPIIGFVGVSDGVWLVGLLGLAAGLEVMARRVDLADMASVRRFYAGIWRLFVAVYVVVGAAALVG
jgi:homogentisate phytyltransferase/homogentisate geranylgeranyltransferase